MASTLQTLIGLLEERHEKLCLRVHLEGSHLVGFVGQRRVAAVNTDRIVKRLESRGPDVSDLLVSIVASFDEQVEVDELVTHLPDRVRESAYR